MQHRGWSGAWTPWQGVVTPQGWELGATVELMNCVAVTLSQQFFHCMKWNEGMSDCSYPSSTWKRGNCKKALREEEFWGRWQTSWEDITDFWGRFGKQSLSFVPEGQLLDELHMLVYTEWFRRKLRTLSRVVPQFNVFALGLCYSQYLHMYCSQCRTESLHLQGWKRTLRSSGLTVHLPPTLPTKPWNPSCSSLYSGQGHLPPNQCAQGPIQLTLNASKGWSIHSSSGQPVLWPHCLQNIEFLTPNLLACHSGGFSVPVLGEQQWGLKQLHLLFLCLRCLMFLIRNCFF